MATITVERRFNGPPDTGNGGYSAGLIATAIGADVAVRLQQPIPLARALTIAKSGDGTWDVRADDAVIATARAVTIEASAPRSPPYSAALAASRHYVGFDQHSWPGCFVCGPRRELQDGLRIFPGAIEGAALHAAPWIPDASLDDGAGRVRPEFIWAALDCPGYFATAHPAPALLGELAVNIERFARIDERCVIVSWPIGRDGRKHRAGTALFGADGERCAIGVATWIELKPA